MSLTWIGVAGVLLFAIHSFLKSKMNKNLIQQQNTKIKSEAARRSYEREGLTLDQVRSLTPTIGIQGQNVDGGSLNISWDKMDYLMGKEIEEVYERPLDSQGRPSINAIKRKVEKKIPPRLFFEGENIVIDMHPQSKYSLLPEYKDLILERLFEAGYIKDKSFELNAGMVPNMSVFEKGLPRPQFDGGVMGSLGKWKAYIQEFKADGYGVLIGISQSLKDKFDPAITLKDGVSLKAKLSQNPHAMFLGATRSGKTKSALSFIYTIMQLYPKTKIATFDGKDGGDLNLLNDAYGIFEKVGTLNNAHANPIIEFDNIVMSFFTEYERRKRLFKELAERVSTPESPVSFSTVIEYNKYARQVGAEELERWLLISDEGQVIFEEWNKFGGYATLINSESMNSAKMLKKLLAEAAAFGFHYIMITQTARDSVLPRVFQTNFTLKFIHGITDADAGVMNQPEAVGMTGGSFYVQGNGLMNKKNKNPLCSFPYIGDAPVFEKFDNRQKRKFDMDLIISTEKLNEASLIRAIKNFFFINEDIECLNPINVGGYNYLDFQFNEKSWRAITIKGPDLNMASLKDIYHRNPLNERNLVFFTLGKTNDKIKSQMRIGDHIIQESSWSRLFHASVDAKEEYVFTNYFENLVGVAASEEEYDIRKDGKEFYNSSQWRTLRAKFLHLVEKRCVLHGGTEETGVTEWHVDHILPRSTHPERALDITNLQLMCKDCNLGKSNHFQKDLRDEKTKALMEEVAKGEIGLSKAKQTLATKEVSAADRDKIVRQVIAENPSASVRKLSEILETKGIKMGKSAVSNFINKMNNE